MIIIDTALERLAREGKQIRVGMVGAGFIGTGVAIQMLKYRQGMSLVGISSRNIGKAKEAFNLAGISDVRIATNAEHVEKFIEEKIHFVTEDETLLCKSSSIDVILEMTWNVEFGAHVAIETISNKKHFVSFNAELFGTLGSVLKHYADKEGVVLTLADGDQPVVQMNLYRFMNGLGVRPVLCGNIKGLYDPYRNPTTQEGFAKRWGMGVEIATSAADGTKISFEQAVVANATGMGVGKRGMYGPTYLGAHISEAVNWYPTEQLLAGNCIVDYVIGAVPSPGVFLLGTTNDPIHNHYLNYYKLGEGPLYCFYTPYHLCNFEIPNTIARVAIFNDTALAPSGKPSVDVIAVAKKKIKTGEIIDGLGGYATYGLCENYDVARSEDLLPMGIAEGCRATRDIDKDEVITFSDVEIPAERLAVKLWREQVLMFSNTVKLLALFLINILEAFSNLQFDMLVFT
jgi:predicted homoserine dehydrogenase-like protein